MFNELRLIRQRDLLRLGGTIFFHDIAWPYGRRDLYYQPNTIPPEFRLEYERKGIIRGRNQLADEGGTSPKQYNAVREGGPRNGVLTAIEDFHALYPSDYDFSLVKAQFGLGILQCRRNRKSVDPLPLLLRIKCKNGRPLWSSRRSETSAIAGALMLTMLRKTGIPRSNRFR